MNVNEGNTYIAYNGASAPFSNFFVAPFEAKVINSNNSQQFQSVEQYFQYSKAILANDNHSAKQLLEETDGTQIKHIGRSIKNFSIVSKKWNEIKYDVLYEGMKAKFLQNQNLQKQLLLTRNKKLIEGNGYDSLYGAGIWTNQITDNNYGPGKNIQGQLLMKVRNELFNHRSLITDKKNQKFKPNHFTSEQVQAANNANLLDFIEDNGVELRRVGHDSYKGVEHDSLVITPSKNSFYWNSMSTGGVGALDFAEKYLLADSSLNKGQKFQKAMEMVMESSAGQFIPHREEIRPFEFNKSQISSKFNQAYAYLTKTRKINPDLINQLHKAGIIEQNQYGDALFLWRDPVTNDVKGTSIQGTKINHQKYGKRGTLKKIEANSTKGYGFNFTVGKPENLYFFEAPIDAMSFYCLHPKIKNAQFIAMDGLKKNVFANYFQIAEKQLQQIGSGVKTVNFGVDNDSAGTNFIENFISTSNPVKYKVLVNSQGEKVPIKRCSPKEEIGKDWNEVLQNKFVNYRPKKLDFQKKQFKLSQEYVQSYAVKRIQTILNDYGLSGRYSKSTVNNDRITTYFGNPKTPEILGLSQVDSEDVLTATRSIAKGRLSQSKVLGKDIDPQRLANESLDFVLAKVISSDLQSPRFGTAHQRPTLNREQIISQVKQSKGYFKDKSEEINNFEITPELSRFHHILKKQDQLLNRKTSQLKVFESDSKTTVKGVVKKGDKQKDFLISLPDNLTNSEQLARIVNQQLLLQKKSIKRSFQNQLNRTNALSM
ncbi:NADAR domain-containing protein [Lactobacillus taiwanensis]|uniref:NADAR domain-containing protein n=1 Tax=Lactobacillus taiwanensis TaxID=508451 RepID=UPI00214AAC09|nr:NADAR domain-containing protein [Lactobacillus taiwanensis]MCR1904008.1 NADAR domain-containing protein [Lactobacillus taiwanensis]